MGDRLLLRTKCFRSRRGSLQSTSRLSTSLNCFTWSSGGIEWFRTGHLRCRLAQPQIFSRALLIHLLDRRCGLVEPAILNHVGKKIWSELSRGPCKPSVTTSLITLLIHHVTTSARLTMMGKGPEIKFPGRLISHLNLISRNHWSRLSLDLLCCMEPCISCQSKRAHWSWPDHLIVLHLRQGTDRHHLRQTSEERGHGDHMEVPLRQVAHELNTSPHIVCRCCHPSRPPILMNCSKLGELLCLFWAFDPGPSIPHILNSPDQGRTWYVRHCEPGAGNWSPGTFQVEPVVGISEPELHTIGIISDRIITSSAADPQLPSRPCMISSHDRAFWPHSICATSALEWHDRHSPSHKDRHHTWEPRLASMNISHQDLIHELLLDRQIRVSPETSEHPVEEDLIAIVDLQVRVGGTCLPEHWPRERLESWVSQCSCRRWIPASAHWSRLWVERHCQDHLDAVQCVVCKERHMEARAGWHHLVALRENIDAGGRVGHDLTHQPCLKRRHQTIVPLVDHHDWRPVCLIRMLDHRREEPGELNLIRVVSSRMSTSTTRTAPSPLISTPSTVTILSSSSSISPLVSHLPRPEWWTRIWTNGWIEKWSWAKMAGRPFGN